MTKRGRANLLLLFAAVIWGFAFTAQKVGGQSMGPFTYSSVRFAMGGALLAFIVIPIMSARKPLSSQERRAATLAVLPSALPCGLLLAIAVNIQQVALEFTSVGNAAFITGLYLVFTPLLGLFFGGRVNGLTLIGIAVAVSGSYFIAVTGDFTIGSGDVIVLGAAVAFAIHILVVDNVAKRVDPIKFSAAQFFSCGFFSAVGALFFDEAPFTGFGDTIIPLLYGGFISVGIAYTLQVIGQIDALPSHGALIMSMESVFGAVGGALLLQEYMSARGLLGAALMTCGLIVSQLGQGKDTDALTSAGAAESSDAGESVASTGPADSVDSLVGS
ncbi:MAG: DMT family transporter [Propionibacteriaceae bacterium]|nr:DMT family transporter [Propionibacteriaceae bacterium]